MSPALLGIDLGGTGSRAALVAGGAREDFAGERIGIAAHGSRVPDAAAALVAEGARRLGGRFDAVAVGATGLATLVADPGAMLERVQDAAGGAPVAIAVDAVTAHLGALEGRAGAVVAVGTGAIAFGTDFAGRWHRVDGWGHLLGDRGAGSWIGLEALRLATRRHDGVDAAGSGVDAVAPAAAADAGAAGAGAAVAAADASALLEAARRRFGEPGAWPAALYTRDDRAAVLAEFAIDVAGLAADGDAAASGVMARAGAEVARSLSAALVPGLPRRAAAVGGVFAAGGAFDAAFDAELARLQPGLDCARPAGTPLDGALRLAGILADAGRLPDGGRLTPRAPYLFVAPAR